MGLNSQHKAARTVPVEMENARASLPRCYENGEAGEGSCRERASTDWHM